MQPDLYAVIGNPIAHSLSPQIHAAFALETEQNLVYERLLADVDRFSEAVEQFRKKGGKGLNVTVPFKQDAWGWAKQRSERAERAGAVNTIVFNNGGSTLADNTDGVGLVRDILHNQAGKIEQQRVLILGAGGAVRGVLAPVLAENPAQLVIANRTVERATELADEFNDLGVISGCGFSDLAGESFDLVINGTAASLQGEVPPLPNGVVTQNSFCYDMMYGKKAETAFVLWAREQGAGCAVDGLGMLVEQAAESFYLWRDVRPKTQPVMAALRI